MDIMNLKIQTDRLFTDVKKFYNMKKKKDKKEVVQMHEQLVDKKQGLTGKKLSFNHESGELIVSENPNPNSVVVDQIYKDGFFSKN